MIKENVLCFFNLLEIGLSLLMSNRASMDAKVKINTLACLFFKKDYTGSPYK